MNMNYYHVKKSKCAACGHEHEERLHLGQFHSGWPFAVHVHPDKGIKTAWDWLDRISEGGMVVDEYGKLTYLSTLMKMLFSMEGPVIEHRRDNTMPNYEGMHLVVGERFDEMQGSDESW